MNLKVKMHCKIYWKRKTSLNKLKTLQQLKRSNLLILRAQLKLMLSWSSSPTEKKGRLSTENVIKMTPGLTKYATSRIEDIKSCFNLFLAEPIEKIWREDCVPVAQWLEHCVSSAKVVVSITREHTY